MGDWFTVVYKEDIFDAAVVLVLIAALIGLVDGLLEDIMLEAFIWSGIFFFGFLLFLHQLFNDKRIAIGLSLLFFGSFLGLMQSVFYFIYSIMRGIAWPGRIWIIPDLWFTMNQFWLSVLAGFIMMIMGYIIIWRAK